MNKLFLFLSGFLLAIGIIATDTRANKPIKTGERIILQVDGLSCPFCAYGLEKKLKALPGVSKLDIRINEGIAILEIESGQTLGDEQLKKAVKDAGFTLRHIKREPIMQSNSTSPAETEEQPKKSD